MMNKATSTRKFNLHYGRFDSAHDTMLDVSSALVYLFHEVATDLGVDDM